MKKILKGNIIRRKAVTDSARNDEVKERMLFASSHDENKVLEKFGTTERGLNTALIEKSIDEYGNNTVTHGKKESLLKRICTAFVNPFTAILFVLALVSVFTDIIYAVPGEQSYITVIIITTMVMISGILRFE